MACTNKIAGVNVEFMDGVNKNYKYGSSGSCITDKYISFRHIDSSTGKEVMAVIPSQNVREVTVVPQ